MQTPTETTLSERIESTGLSLMRAARLAGINARLLYNGETLTDDERSRIETVLSRVERGEIPSRRRAAVTA